MIGKFLILIAVVISGAAADCVPSPADTFYYKTPCDDQKYDSKITISNVKASQNGQDVTKAGGIDLSAIIDMQVDFKNTYGAIKKPLFDVSLRVYSHIPLVGCKWVDVPTLGLASNLDPCKITTQCHLDKNETSVAVAVNMKDLAGPLIDVAIVGDYYSTTVTYKDDKTPLSCVYAQTKVIKK